MDLLAVTLPGNPTPEQVRQGLIVGSLVFLALAFLAIRFVQKVIVRGVLAVFLVVLAFLSYVERAPLADCARTCDCKVLGFEIQVPKCQPSS